MPKKRDAYAEFDRVIQLTEWILEPCTPDGDILDPWPFDRAAGGRPAAEADVPNQFTRWPEAAWVDLSRHFRRGSEAQVDRGTDKDVRTYLTRFYRDGRVVALTPDGDEK